MDPDDGSNRLAKRCGSCARFVRVSEIIDQNGEVKRAGQCLLGVWPAPLYETNTCSQYVKKGTFRESISHPAARQKSLRRKSVRGPDGAQREAPTPFIFTLPEEILEMDADEFRSILRDVIRD